MRLGERGAIEQALECSQRRARAKGFLETDLNDDSDDFGGGRFRQRIAARA